MNCAISCLCRGSGKIYIEIEIKTASSNDVFVARSFVDNEDVPVFITSKASTNSSEVNKIIVTMFDMNVAQKLIIFKLTPFGTEEEVFATIIDPVLSFFKSKYNTVFAKELCEAIRRYDNYRSIYCINMSPIRLVPDALDGWILYLCIHSEEIERSEFDAEAIYADGKRKTLDIAPFRVTGANIGHTGNNASYAVRVPIKDPNKSVCIGVRQVDDSKYIAMRVFTKFFFRDFVKQYKSKYLDATSDPSYDIWFLSQKTQKTVLATQKKSHFSIEPLFSIVVPLYETPIPFFTEMIESVIAQSYCNWELVLVNASPRNASLSALISEYVDSEKRVKVINLESNLGITENTKVGISRSIGDYICFFDHDDILEPDILYEYAKAINNNPEIGLLYCDEDKVLPNGFLQQPSFKPDFNYYLLCDNNYICHLLTIKMDVYKRLDDYGKHFDGAQDHALSLQVAELGVPIHHVPKILYHWRVSKNSTASNSDSKPYATQAGISALQRHMARRGIDCSVECSHGRAFRYKIDYAIEPGSTFDVVLTSCNSGNNLKKRIESISKDPLINRIILVANSDDQDILLMCESFSFVDVVFMQNGENWSHVINAAIAVSCSKYVFVMEATFDVESSFWSHTLLGLIQNQNVAIVSPMICDAAGIIRSAGVSFAYGLLFSLFCGLTHDSPGYLFRALSTQEVSSVDPSCFMIDKAIFNDMGAIDETIQNPFLAMCDYCFRLDEKKMRIVYSPEVEVRSFAIEVHTPYIVPDSPFLSRWAEKISGIDRFLNPNLSREPARASRFKIDTMLSL